jgi:hypothetical protein
MYRTRTAATSRSRLRKGAWDGRPDWYWILERATLSARQARGSLSG